MLLGLLEGETAAAYPDPALQVPIDLSHVSYLLTANATGSLPAALRDRLRVLAFPSPGPGHLDLLLPGLLDAAARDRGLDPAWIPMLEGFEIEALRSSWEGGSVRRLRGLLDAVLSARERCQTRH